MKTIPFEYRDGGRTVKVDYIPRLMDSLLENKLKAFGAVLLRGPKWCGKTTTAIVHSKSYAFLARKTMKETYDSYLLRPQLFIDGPKPKLLDEWQSYPLLWDLVKEECDIRNQPSLFVLTGSYSPKLGTTNHTGSMRIYPLNMNTLTLYESGDSSGEVSLKDICQGKDVFGTNPLTYERITERMVKGGYPAAYDRKTDDLNAFGKSALSSIAETDIQETTGKELRENVTRAILRSLARNLSQYAKNTTIIQDVAEIEPLSETTFYTYYDGLLRLNAVKEIEAWSPALRSKENLRMGPKREFSDVSLAVAALGLSAEDLNNDPHTRGFFFENFVWHDLAVYGDCIDAKIGHYHDSLGLECDFTIHLANGEYGLIEVKQGEALLPDAVSTLNKFDALVDSYNVTHPNAPMKKAKFKLVITGDSAYARRGSDGIYVVPIGVLKP